MLFLGYSLSAGQQTLTLYVRVRLPLPHLSKCSSVWESACFGSKMPQVQVLSLRLIIKLEVSKMDQLVNLLWIGVFTGGFCFLLVFGELFMNALYEFFPPYRRWFDKQLEKMPNWDEEVEE